MDKNFVSKHTFSRSGTTQVMVVSVGNHPWTVTAVVVSSSDTIEDDVITFDIDGRLEPHRLTGSHMHKFIKISDKGNTELKYQYESKHDGLVTVVISGLVHRDE